jgi:hypothetical protein
MDSNRIEYNQELFSNYNEKRYIEILTLKNEGRVFNNELQLEKLQYAAILRAQIEWLTRSEYLNLLESVLNQKISIGKFRVKFSNRMKKNSTVMDVLEENLVILPPNLNALNFAVFIDEIYEYCELLPNRYESLPDSDPKLEKINFDFSNNKFQSAMKTYFDQMRIYSEE